MWKVLAKSVQGSGHKRLGTVCQDACQTSVLMIGGQEILIVAAADGAGSAELSDIGAQMACQVIHEVITAQLQQQSEFQAIGREQVVAWYEHVRQQLQLEAESRGVPIRQLACTLLVAIIGDQAAALCQVGDGAIVIRDGEALRPVFWPQSGEYANTTNFITGAKLDQDLMFAWHDGPIDELSAFTDGLQPVALNYSTKQAHQPFFTPMIEALRKSPDPTELHEPMQSFLESKNLTDRTDDDLTLILAIRTARND